MARGCNCAGASCGCSVIAGQGIRVEGIGTKASPFVITNIGTSVGDAIAVQTTSTIRMERVGEGTPQDPVVLSAYLEGLSFSDLADVEGVPEPGDVPVWAVVDGIGGWRPGATPTTPPGAVTTSSGLAGDGSGGAPLRARTSAMFGQGVLAGYGSDTTVGAPIYTDDSGALRAAPAGARRITSSSRPTSRGGTLVYETDRKTLLLGHDSGYEQISGVMPPGGVIMYGGATVPDGWLPCDGATYARSEYPALAAARGALGTVAGDPLRFRVPDMRGRVPAGVDPDQTEFNAIGKRGGSKTHTLSTSEMPSHVHRQTFNTGAIAPGGGNAVGGMTSSDNAAPERAQQSTLAAGNGLPHNNLQPYETIPFLIRAF